jgi:hypothetical protein
MKTPKRLQKSEIRYWNVVCNHKKYGRQEYNLPALTRMEAEDNANDRFRERFGVKPAECVAEEDKS